MIVHIEPGSQDRASLAELQARATAAVPVPVDRYRRRVVIKPWGHEFLAYDTPGTAVWCLHINAGHSTSMHCHARKKTSLIVLAGEGLCEMVERCSHVRVHDAVVFQPGVFHATTALSAGGLDLLEVETPSDKTDLVRLSDRYGRECVGYEGASHTRADRLEQFGFFWLKDQQIGSGHVDAAARFRTGVFRCGGAARVRAVPRPRWARLFAILHGTVRDRDGRVVAGPGDPVHPSDVQQWTGRTGEGLLLLAVGDAPRAHRRPAVDAAVAQRALAVAR